jgi:hypothetical protein
MKKTAIFLSIMLFSIALLSSVNAQNLLGGNQKQTCSMGNEKITVTATYQKNGGNLDINITYPSKTTTPKPTTPTKATAPANSQIIVTNPTVYVYEGSNLLKKQVENGDFTLAAGGKEINFKLTGITPKSPTANLDIVVSGKIKGKSGTDVSTIACGSTTAKAQSQTQSSSNNLEPLVPEEGFTGGC